MLCMWVQRLLGVLATGAVPIPRLGFCVQSYPQGSEADLTVTRARRARVLRSQYPDYSP